MREVTVAAVQLAPSSAPLTAETIATNGARAVAMVRDCAAATAAELVVLPESVTTGFTPGVDVETLWDLVSAVPGPVLDPYAAVAADLGIHLVVGTYERDPRRGVVHNAAVLLGPSGDVLGVYRKTHPFGGERADRGGWVTPGDDICVVDTPLGRIGLIICFDGDNPELSRITAIKGAEIICRPSALLRSADIWELTNRARAYDNHVYVIGANATGVDPAGIIYFGNSMIVTPIAEVVARAASHECWVSARLDPATALASLTPGSSVPQPFDHLADRNLALIRRHADALLGEAATSFVHGGKPDDIVD
ncbi:MAG: carbon-nitrogen hydrolase family protein [Pseudonocardiales bacterium]|nr:MAG: carbon-nitrogen hydrolase family protein [Pseudonocardiales bacterium]